MYIASSSIETTDTTLTVQSLKPFTTYEYTLEACTDVGCTNGSAASVSTSEGTPTGLHPPSLVGLSSTTVQASWTSPLEPNGIVTHYELLRVFGEDLSETELVANTTGLVAVVSGLLPSTVYYFKVVAFNSVGSVTSNVSSVTTPEDTPEQIQPPNIAVISSTSLLVTWQEPLQPNGVITNYTLFRNGASVFTGKANFSYLDTGLSPFTSYSYFILVCTAKGCGASSSNLELTDEAVPQSIQEPTVILTLPYSALLNVLPVGQPNGIVRYVLRVTGEYLIGYDANENRLSTDETRVVFNDSMPNEVNVSGLLPFTSYSMQLEVKNTAGSLFGETTTFTTLPAGQFHLPYIIFNYDFYY